MLPAFALMLDVAVCRCAELTRLRAARYEKIRDALRDMMLLLRAAAV